MARYDNNGILGCKFLMYALAYCYPLKFESSFSTLNKYSYRVSI